MSWHFAKGFREKKNRRNRRDAIEGVLWDIQKYKIMIDKNEQMFYPINIRTFVP